MRAQPGQFLPVLTAIARPEEGGVLHPSVDGVRVGQRRLEMPHSRELPRVGRIVVPEVRAGRTVVGELVTHRLPAPPAVARALDHLPEPAARLRGVDAVRIGGRGLHVVDLPASEVWPADVPRLPRAVGSEDERTLTRAHQHPYPAHPLLLPGLAPDVVMMSAVHGSANDPLFT